MKLLFSNEWLRDKIAGDPDVELECGEPLEGRTMTISIQVSVNGNYKVPVTVKRGAAEPTTEVVSGRGHEGPKILYIPYYHGSDGDVVVTVGKEEQDNG